MDTGSGFKKIPKSKDLHWVVLIVGYDNETAKIPLKKIIFLKHYGGFLSLLYRINCVYNNIVYIFYKNIDLYIKDLISNGWCKK